VNKLSKLLLDDKPLIILPSLAEKIGLNESIVLQQLHYWLLESKNVKEGNKWVYNTYKDWQKQFPFWSEKTIQRTITKLENEGYILTGNYNKMRIDQTKWYRIDYDKLVSRPVGQNDQMEGTSCPDGYGQNDHTNNQRVPETTTEKVQYAEFVTMKENEYLKLVDKYGELRTKRMIEILDNYKGANGKKYKSDYRAILNWVVDRVTKESGQPSIIQVEEKESVISGFWGDGE